MRAKSTKPANDAVLAEPSSTQGSLALHILSDGASVRVDEHAAEIRDNEGRLLVRYKNGEATVVAASGDLKLAAPNGRVVVQAGTDIELEASGDLRQKAQHRMEFEARRVQVRADESRLTVAQAAVTAERILTTANVIAHNVERFELSATRIVEKTRETFREASGLVETRAGRVRAIVEDVYSLFARRTSLASKEDTSIDGKKVLLG
ncbi:MAG: DUF3540 domain-containing protein [Polyangiaceae bacterium]|nr:DUF3540 domain-containing protein [Polyangiaceae bacterium]